MKLFRNVMILLALAASTSFADTTPPAGSGSGGDSVSASDAARFMAFWDKLVAVIQADKDACPKMGTDINALVDANQAIVDLAKKAHDAGKKLPSDAQAHIQDSMKKVMPSLMTCYKDPTVKAALGRLQLGGQGGGPPAH